MALGKQKGYSSFGGVGGAGGNMDSGQLDPGKGFKPLPPLTNLGDQLPQLPPNRVGFKKPMMSTPIEGGMPPGGAGGNMPAPQNGGMMPPMRFPQGDPTSMGGFQNGLNPQILALLAERMGRRVSNLPQGNVPIMPLLNGGPSMGFRPQEGLVGAPAFQRREVDYSQMNPNSRWFPGARLS